jgi:putative oxidoreductase
MDIRRFFTVPEQTSASSLALFLLRFVTGLAFMFHGWGKIQNAFGWMGEDSWAPGILQALAAFSEFGGGLALIIGLLTSLASLGLASTMAVALYIHAIVKGDPFVGRGGSYELALVYLVVSILLIVLGPGRLSLDYKIFGSRT